MKKTVIKTGIQYGVQVALAFIAYFITMRMFNLTENFGLRFFNILILITGIYYAIKNYKDTHVNTREGYFKGIAVGVVTSFFGTLIFSFFMYVYMSFNPLFVLAIQESSFGEMMNIYIITFSILIEGFGLGAVSTFIVMQWLKVSHMSKSVQKV